VDLNEIEERIEKLPDNDPSKNLLITLCNSIYNEKDYMEGLLEEREKCYV